MRYGLIGGTGVYDPSLLQDTHSKQVKTPYGTVDVQVGAYEGREVVFMPRHGADHSIPPHKINYRANIWGMKALGVNRLFATNAVGSVNRLMRPGDMVIIDQYLDFTKYREHTFFDGQENPVAHTDVTEPYCPELRTALLSTGQQIGLALHPRGCYACFEGPRFETAAEIRMVGILGGDLVGMTNVPEATLAREAGICYATIAMVTNMGAGISETPLTHEEVVELMAANIDRVKKLAMETLLHIPETIRCSCGQGRTPLRGLPSKHQDS